MECKHDIWHIIVERRTPSPDWPQDGEVDIKCKACGHVRDHIPVIFHPSGTCSVKNIKDIVVVEKTK